MKLRETRTGSNLEEVIVQTKAIDIHYNKGSAIFA